MSNYYCGEINVSSDDPQKCKSVAEAIQKHLWEAPFKSLKGSDEFENAPWIRDINSAIPEIHWSKYGRLVYKHFQFLESLTRDTGVQIATNESSNSDGMHTVTWLFMNGHRVKVLDHEIFIDDIEVAGLAGFALRDMPKQKAKLANALGRLDRDHGCYDNVCALVSVMSVIQTMQIQPSKDDISGWLAVREYIAEIDDDYYDPDDIAEAVSYIETACLKTMYGDESTPKSHAATI